VSCELSVDEARAVVTGWVRAQVAADPAFRSAFLTGSATDLPGAAPLPRSSDVDLTVLVAASSTAAVDRPVPGAASGPTDTAASGRRSGKRLVDGVLVDVSYLDERTLADPAWVAASFVYAPSFRGGQVLADPTGHLGRLEAAIAPSFATPAAVRARTADVHRRIRARLTALDPHAAWADLVLHWLFPTSLAAVARLVAALRMPTVRLRYLRARAVTPPAEYERLLALLGCADAPPGLVARHLDAVGRALRRGRRAARRHRPVGRRPPPPVRRRPHARGAAGRDRRQPRPRRGREPPGGGVLGRRDGRPLPGRAQHPSAGPRSRTRAGLPRAGDRPRRPARPGRPPGPPLRAARNPAAAGVDRRERWAGAPARAVRYRSRRSVAEIAIDGGYTAV
jgi:hypothetical protein